MFAPDSSHILITDLTNQLKSSSQFIVSNEKVVDLNCILMSTINKGVLCYEVHSKKQIGVVKFYDVVVIIE